MYHSNEFDTVYLHKNDIKNWKSSLVFSVRFGEVFSKLKPQKYKINKFIQIDENYIINLGNVSIKTINAFGHTPGSVCFIDNYHKIIFTGDAVGSGSGVLLCIPGSLKIQEYNESLKKLILKLEPYKEYTFLGGHSNQSIKTNEEPKNSFFLGSKGTPYAKPLNFKIVEDMQILCEKIITKTIIPQKTYFLGFTKLAVYEYKNARITLKAKY
ncbi:MBL fold metallo-hydrolase [Oceanotoga sp. DSM 15011]|uniref:MBL fold metallo-hydrolase n=1 Tax=Oceanotoga sp. DSM 15011 TaxID=2984951 RepID=UPI0021F40906|nr:MBL fold metallo-hydrolase [Oceanotoga sp. DSM 15011]UYO99519.1 MBL fold metallo-hydrolase [Oceanotoga sp. DSM 15011]